jgi:hypothetical protein
MKRPRLSTGKLWSVPFYSGSIQTRKGWSVPSINHSTWVHVLGWHSGTPPAMPTGAGLCLPEPRWVHAPESTKRSQRMLQLQCPTPDRNFLTTDELDRCRRSRVSVFSPACVVRGSPLLHNPAHQPKATHTCFVATALPHSSLPRVHPAHDPDGTNQCPHAHGSIGRRPPSTWHYPVPGGGFGRRFSSSKNGSR